MQRFLILVLALALFSGGASARLNGGFGYPYPYPRYPRRPYPKRTPQHRYKGDAEVNRTLRDLNALNYPVLAKDQRKAAERAIKGLHDFQKKRYEAKWDDKKINRVLGDLDKLTTAPNLTDKDRDRLSADLNALREMESRERGAKIGAPPGP